MDNSRGSIRKFPSSDRGLALAQVLVMAMILLLLAAGLLQMVFQNHVVLVRSQSSDVGRARVEACMANFSASWNGVPCGTTTRPTTVNCNLNGMTVIARCPSASEPNKVEYEVTIP